MPWLRSSAVVAASLATFVVAGAWYVSTNLRDAVGDQNTPPSASEKEQAMNSESTPSKTSAEAASVAGSSSEKVVKTDDEWRKTLTEMQYYVMRQKGTEQAFTGEYWNTKTPGTYHCAGCGEPLFKSEAKFDSHCGWPSFYQPLDGLKDKRVEEHSDRSHFMVRTEVTCRKCGAHLGHVFDDSPQTPTGMRYCINSASIKLQEKKADDAQTKSSDAEKKPDAAK
ncbi:MAG: peptide-methionine (R)-S-oxide reductase MsrB [Pirellulales bacterium]